MGGLIRTAPWVTLAGALLMLSGLNRDARMHALDPSLASREGIFTFANPAHALLAAGVALVVAGTVLFLLGKTSRAGGTVATRVASALLALLLVLMSLQGFAGVAKGDGGDGHAHMHGSAPPAAGPATPEQQAAAAKLLRDVKASLARYADLGAAQAAGYRQTTPYRFLRWGPAHFHNRALNRDDRLLDAAWPEALVYMKLPNGGHALMGAMFLAPKGTGPRPAGPITDWHVHDNLCVTSTGSVALAVRGQCPAGSFFIGSAVEMMHVWIFDNPDGPFAHSLSPQAIRAGLKQFTGR